MQNHQDGALRGESPRRGDWSQTSFAARPCSLGSTRPLGWCVRGDFPHLTNLMGRMERITYPDGEVLTYTYDKGGQIKTATGVHKEFTTQYVAEIGYDTFGQRTDMRLGNGTETHYTYDENRRWLDTIQTNNDKNLTLQNIAYNFDAVGNVAAYTNAAGKYTTSQTFEYDNLYQLTSVKGSYEFRPYGVKDFGSTYGQTFRYDVIGNLQSKISEQQNSPPGSRFESLDYYMDYKYYADKPHQAEQIGNYWYLYDANGNTIEERANGHSPANTAPTGITDTLIAENVHLWNYGVGLVQDNGTTTDHTYRRSFTWDEENRLKHVVDANTNVSYLYDANGERTAKLVNNTESLYFDAMWNLTEDGHAFRQSKHIYVSTARIASKLNMEGDGSTGYERVNTYYYHSDHLGSAQVVTDYTGGLYEHIEYAPFGEMWIEEKPEYQDLIPYRFTGKEYDQETKLYYCIMKMKL